MKLLNDNILLVAAKNELKKSKIILPETADKARPEEGIVMAFAAGVDIGIRVGDRVLFTKYGPTEVKIEDKEYLIAKPEDVIAIL